MTKEKARRLSAALDVVDGALSIQGPLISGLLAKWEGDQGNLKRFPQDASWSRDQAKDVRHRLGILSADPAAELMFMGLSHVLDTWKDYEEHKGQIAEYVDEFKKAKPQTALRITKVASGIEASIQLYQRWAQGQNVAGAKAVLELNKYFGITGDRLKLKNIDYMRELLKLQKIEDAFQQPWKWQQGLRAFLTTKLKIPLPAKLMAQAPGLSFLDKLGLPLAIVHGVKEMALPDHKGVLGGFDRGMGVVEAGGAAAAIGGEAAALGIGASVGVAAAVPVVGWAALGVAGAYFLGTWAWDNREAIKNTTKKAWNATTKWAGGVADKGKEIAHDAKKAVTNLVPNTIKKFKFW
ncbi:hypothetical protein [Streptomyces sp. NPDC051994]|uniref:hypothetical protein n=1 Tax=unclassified Streptomyces TaxID=2593676 RepID=UPI00343FE1F0